MRFCPNCENILFPRNKKLYCKACNEEFELDKETEDFKIIKKIHHDEKESAPIVIKEAIKNDRISAQDRKAYEEFFGSGEMDSY